MVSWFPEYQCSMKIEKIDDVKVEDMKNIELDSRSRLLIILNTTSSLVIVEAEVIVLGMSALLEYSRGDEV